MRNFQRLDYSATMWKTFYLHLLILFTIDFPRDRFTGAEPIRLDAELVTRDEDHNYRLRDNDMRGRITNDHYLPRANLNEDERTTELVGKWRSTGEALEPKWRDGDNVPLLPFSHFSQYPKEELETSEQEGYQNRERSNYPRQKDRGSYYRGKSDGRTFYSDHYRDYDLIENERRYEGDQDFYRNSRPSIALMASVATIFEKEKDDSVKDVTPPTYREVLQSRPNNNYEHELDDEEYLRPRPRKRRPPQNYEFVLAANEALLRNQNMQAAQRTQSRENTRDNSANQLPTNTSTVLEKKDNAPRTGTSQHAVQLKSLLKMQQEEGLSLSEILQRRNLTLNDLLKGKADVISALKSEDTDESDEYMEEVSRIMSNSIKKISTTETTPWQSTLEAVKLEDSQKESQPVRSDLSESKVLSTTGSTVSALVENSVDNGRISSNGINQIQTSSTTGKTKNIKSIIVTLNPLLIKSTTPAGIPTMLTTSTTSSTSLSTPVDVATNSMEFVQNDDSSVTIEKNRDLKMEKIEEDEIMEFSDFPDYRKEKNAVIPIWLMMEKAVTIKPSDGKGMDKQKDTGSTLSIEQLLSSTERTKMLVSPKANEPIEIDLTDIKIDKSSENNYESIEKPADDYSAFLEHEYQDDGPVMPYDLDDISTLSFLNNSDDRANIKSHHNGTKNDQSTVTEDLETNTRDKSPENHQGAIVKDRPYEDIISEIEPEARAEIFELFASSSAGKRLERLLKSRNMSIDELIALRQRGSSKVHLAEIARLKVSTPIAQTSMDENTENKTIGSSDSMKHQHEFNNRNVEIDINEKTNTKGPESNLYIQNTWLQNKTNNVLTSNSMNLNDLDTRNTEMATDVDKHEDTNAVNIYERNESFQRETEEQIPKRMEEIVDLLTTFASLPFAKNIKRNLTADITDYDNLIERKLITQNNDVSSITENNSVEVKDTNDATNTIESGYVEQVEKEDSYMPSSREHKTTINNIVEEDSSYDEKRTLSKVKPSIIASGVILGVTLVVFLAILIACRIRQKQRYRYRNAFSKAVFQGPINAARKLSNSSSLSTVMVNVVAMSTTKRPGRNELHDNRGEFESKSDIDNDSLDANDSWETIPDYMK